MFEEILLKAAFKFLALKIHHLMKRERDREREKDLGTFLDEGESDIGCESDVGLDGKDQLNLDLDSEHSEDNL